MARHPLSSAQHAPREADATAVKDLMHASSMLRERLWSQFLESHDIHAERPGWGTIGHLAARDGRMDIVSEWHDRGGNLMSTITRKETWTGHGDTVLSVAARYGNHEIMEWCLKRITEPVCDASITDGYDFMKAIIDHGSVKGLEIWMSYGGDPHVKVGSSTLGHLFGVSGKYDLLHAWYGYGVDPHVRNHMGESIGHAICTGRCDDPVIISSLMTDWIHHGGSWNDLASDKNIGWRIWKRKASSTTESYICGLFSEWVQHGGDPNAIMTGHLHIIDALYHPSLHDVSCRYQRLRTWIAHGGCVACVSSSSREKLWDDVVRIASTSEDPKVHVQRAWIHMHRLRTRNAKPSDKEAMRTPRGRKAAMDLMPYMTDPLVLAKWIQWMDIPDHPCGHE
jgi:hypothetical protein